jgi:hypothetical protein
VRQAVERLMENRTVWKLAFSVLLLVRSNIFFLYNHYACICWQKMIVHTVYIFPIFWWSFSYFFDSQSRASLYQRTRKVRVEDWVSRAPSDYYFAYNFLFSVSNMLVIGYALMRPLSNSYILRSVVNLFTLFFPVKLQTFFLCS